jgi:hypothetical protein
MLFDLSRDTISSPFAAQHRLSPELARKSAVLQKLEEIVKGNKQVIYQLRREGDSLFIWTKEVRMIRNGQVQRALPRSKEIRVEISDTTELCDCFTFMKNGICKHFAAVVRRFSLTSKILKYERRFVFRGNTNRARRGRIAHTARALTRQ